MAPMGEGPERQGPSRLYLQGWTHQANEDARRQAEALGIKLDEGGPTEKGHVYGCVTR